MSLAAASHPPRSGLVQRRINSNPAPVESHHIVEQKVLNTKNGLSIWAVIGSLPCVMGCRPQYVGSL
jgi:hypothetical protein